MSAPLELAVLLAPGEITIGKDGRLVSRRGTAAFGTCFKGGILDMSLIEGWVVFGVVASPSGWLIVVRGGFTVCCSVVGMIVEVVSTYTGGRQPFGVIDLISDSLL